MDQKGEELAEVLAEIRQRVRARNPNGTVSDDIPLPDLTPLLHARDAAEGKVASIGSVNPRPPGLLNSTVQRVKRMVARALDWHIREQVEFNRAIVACVQSTIEALTEGNRAVVAMSAKIEALSKQSNEEFHALRNEAQQLVDVRTHWSQWRVEWEQKLAANEIHFLKSVAELQSAFQHRVTLMDAGFREQVKAQHANFEAAMVRQSEEVHKRFWADLDGIRTQYETVIHAELRLTRQKASLRNDAGQVAGSAPLEFTNIDWLKFAEKFRGSEEAVRQRQGMYAERFRGHAPVLDIGSGRGEMLEVFREAGIAAHGIDLNDDSIALCRSKGLDAEKADLFAYLNSLADASLGGVVCSQVVEHLPPERLPEMIRLLHEKLRAGGLIAIETPNSECLAIFATHFYIDPTHRHPIPVVLMSFYLEEAGFGRIEVERLFPAVETMPSLAELPEAFRKEFFGALDYAVFATRLG
ncbi:MAG TPA: class I SAM-dependent methyltransferase [Bryobacteraceae bacterium]|jgi:O-antigen chain-terminating methyltransferase|nr:class I SAM-dependent methyltransferase [Bryobacteraceae bacterium]